MSVRVSPPVSSRRRGKNGGVSAPAPEHRMQKLRRCGRLQHYNLAISAFLSLFIDLNIIINAFDTFTRHTSVGLTSVPSQISAQHSAIGPNNKERVRTSSGLLHGSVVLFQCIKKALINKKNKKKDSLESISFLTLHRSPCLGEQTRRAAASGNGATGQIVMERHRVPRFPRPHENPFQKQP